LKRLLTTKEKQRVQILAISIDPHGESQRLVQELEERFPGEFDFSLLEDETHRVIDRYGILNPSSPGWPHPATYVINKTGVVRWRLVERDYTHRASNEDILQALRGAL
jgi:peroxiredoxin